MGETEIKNELMYYLTRRIAIAYYDNDYKEGILSKHYSYMDTLIDKVKGYADLPISDYSLSDVFQYTGLNFGDRYREEVEPIRDKVLEKYPEADLGLFEDFLEHTAYRRCKVDMYSGLSEDLLKKCMYMLNNVPAMATPIQKDRLLTTEDILSLPENAIKDCLNQIIDFDNAFQLYHLEYKTCNDIMKPYINDGKKDNFLLNYDQEPEEDKEDIERD